MQRRRAADERATHAPPPRAAACLRRRNHAIPSSHNTPPRPRKPAFTPCQVDAYASSLLAALKHFRDAHGLKFDTLSPFNEPGSPAWIVGMSSQEGCYFSHARMDDVSARRQACAHTAVRLQLRARLLPRGAGAGAGAGVARRGRTL